MPLKGLTRFQSLPFPVVIRNKTFFNITEVLGISTLKGDKDTIIFLLQTEHLNCSKVRNSFRYKTLKGVSPMGIPEISKLKAFTLIKGLYCHSIRNNTLRPQF